MIANPVLPGFHPDPSWVRIDGWTWCVTSTFAWLPGLPVYRSRDLATWEAMPPVLADPGVLDLAGCACDDGLYAPGIRHDGRRFLLACTLVQRQQQRFRNFLCTSEDPARGWSAPVWLPEGIGRIDPTPFVAPDGGLWLVLNDLPSTTANHGANREIRAWRLDPDSPQPVDGPHVLWHGALVGASTPEAPRLFFRDGWYWLLIAEGGTGGTHAVTMARSRELTGPYTGCPANPLLTHRHLGPRVDVQCVGHADLLEWDDGSWWGCCLAERQPDGRRVIGRETWITPVDWPAGSWPVFAPGSGRLPPRVPAPTATDAPAAPTAGDPVHGWLALRDWPQRLATVRSRESVRLAARAVAIDDRQAAPALLARRITAPTGGWTVELVPEGDAIAGVLLYSTDGAWVRIALRAGQAVVEDAKGAVLASAPLPLPARLRWRWSPTESVAELADGAAWRTLATVATATWARPVFAGAVVAVSAEGATGAVAVRVLAADGVA